MSNIGTIKVPSEGPKNARIFLVGEAPGADEETARRPFVGAAGEFLERYLGRCSISRSDVYLSNLSKFRPKGNKFEYLLGSTELSEGLEELKEEILEVNPVIIGALGNWPMYYLTGLKSDKRNAEPGSGISLWRGSCVPSTLVEGYKVLVTYHPAYIVRPQGYENHPIFESDLGRLNSEAESRSFRHPTYEAIIDPPADVLRGLVEEFKRAKFLSVDIETFGDKLACVGFCDRPNRALCLTTFHQEINWPIIQELLESPPIKIFQYGIFDINYMEWFYGWRTTNYGWDTYVAQNNLMPGFDKDLATIASFYTLFNYWKEERKIWRENMDLGMLWRYNCKDVVATYLAAMEQIEMMGYVFEEVA